MMPLRIAGTGLVTGIGHNTAETCTSIDAGIRRFRETPIRGFDGHPLVASLVLPVSPDFEGVRRASALAGRALLECLADAEGERPRRNVWERLREDPAALAPSPLRTALFLCTEQPRPQLADPLAAIIRRGEDWGEPLLDELAGELTNRKLPPVHKEFFRNGHAGGLLAVQRAAALLESGEADQCIVGGVHAPGERGVLEALDAYGEINSPRVPHAPIPGEAAAFVCLQRDVESPGALRAAVVATAVTPDAGEEPRAGVALTSAMSTALADWRGDTRTISLVAADLNGDRERAKQMTIASMRTLWREGALPELIHPADRVGDVDAAAGPLLLAIAARRLIEGDRTRSALVVCSTPGILHGAAVLGGPARSRS